MLRGVERTQSVVNSFIMNRAAPLADVTLDLSGSATCFCSSLRAVCGCAGCASALCSLNCESGMRRRPAGRRLLGSGRIPSTVRSPELLQGSSSSVSALTRPHSLPHSLTPHPSCWAPVLSAFMWSQMDFLPSVAAKALVSSRWDRPLRSSEAPHGGRDVSTQIPLGFDQS